MVQNRPSIILPHDLRMVAWEITRSCNLDCIHCRAAAKYGPYEGEPATEQCLALLDDIASLGTPVVILTGGEPYLREDIFYVAAEGDRRGLRMVLATNGTMVTDEIARKTREAGIRRVSISIDGADGTSHDTFRGVHGAYDAALRGIEAFRQAGVEFQVNTTVTERNRGELDLIMKRAERLGAAAHHIFLLVPTGRARDMAHQAMGPDEYEETLLWYHEREKGCSMQLKATCAPQYYRIYHQNRNNRENDPGRGGELHTMTRGCMGGSSFCFISHRGQVQPCGFLEIDCGQLSCQSFQEIWEDSPIFRDLRNLSRYEGKCGRCEFIRVCGGCRARAYEATGSYLAEEPLCPWEPGSGRSGSFAGER
ncbi:MAG: heme b synthase [Syntrophales bacterium]|nr:heme b synthase [Syntrophales bacterium]MCK9527289.1 heme b synthase [Syntrophales bacterium]MDX9921241.1 heme b synthase [Syntrophales bacterium]